MIKTDVIIIGGGATGIIERTQHHPTWNERLRVVLLHFHLDWIFLTDHAALKGPLAGDRAGLHNNDAPIPVHVIQRNEASVKRWPALVHGPETAVMPTPYANRPARTYGELDLH